MIYFEHGGKHYFTYGVFNMWDEGLAIPGTDEPVLLDEVAKDIKAWGGIYRPTGLEIIFDTAEGATMFRLKYGTENLKDEWKKRATITIDEHGNQVYHLKGQGLSK